MINLLAYIDPGSGGIIIQSIVAGFVGIGVALKIFWQRIVGFIRFGSKNSEKEESEKLES